MPVVTSLQPMEEQKPKASNLPYEQPGQLTPITNAPKQVTSQDLQQGSNQVMQAAQNTALSKVNQPDETMGLVQSGVQGLLKAKPANNQKYINNQLEQYDRNRAQAMAAFQQQNADISNTGVNREAAYNFAMQGAQGRSDAEQKLLKEQQDAERAALLQNLQLGTSTAQAQSGLDTEAFNRLINARGAFEGERAQTSANEQQMSVLDKTYGQDVAKMVMSQDWQGGQAALDREAAVLAQSTDIAAKNAFADKQNAFDMAKLNATQDWQSQQNKIAQNLQLALQSNDINATQANLQKQIDLDKWKQANGQEFSAQQSAINRALEVTLKTMDQDSAKNLMQLKDQLDNGMLTRQQDFTSVQQELDRQLELAKQSNDIQGQREIETLRGEINTAAETAQREWNTSERLSSQVFTAGQTMDKQTFDRETQRLDQLQQTALQDNDINAQKYIANAKNNLELNMQLQGFDHDTAMAKLDSQIAEAKANNDLARQHDLINYQTLKELETMTAAQGFDIAKMGIQNGFEESIKNNDFVRASAMQKAQFDFTAKEAAADRALETMKIDLQQQGVDMAKVEQIMAGVAAGTIDSAAGVEALKGIANDLGVTVEAPNAMKQQQDIDNQYALMQYQFGKTHPDMVNEDGMLTDAGIKQFNEWQNEAQNTPAAVTATTIKDTSEKIASKPEDWVGAANENNPLNVDYKNMLLATPAFDLGYKRTTRGGGGISIYTFKAPKAVGEYINVNGRLMKVASDVTSIAIGKGWEQQQFMAYDVNTGKNVTVTAKGEIL